MEAGMIRGVILDLDGTVYRGDAEVPGAAAFVRRLRDDGLKHLFVTNRANRRPGEICAQLHGFGIACRKEDVLTSGQAAAQYLKTGTVYIIGEDGLREALEQAGLTINEATADYVVVSFDRTFTYEKLRTACRLIRQGSTFIATNPDQGLQTKEGIEPGTGSIVAAVKAGCGGVQPVVIGKPERLILDIAVDRLGLPAGHVIAVGDNIDTDIPAAHKAGLRSALILTGMSSREDAAAAPVRPTWVVQDFGALSELVHTENNG
jgi:4-nitrophenyl phosphatase